MSAPVPSWLHRLVAAVRAADTDEFVQLFTPPDDSPRRSAVLVLFGEGPSGPDLLFIERSADMRHHAGQPAFPGGRVDPDDDGPVAAALREAQEETGLDPSGVEVLATLSPLWLPPSNFMVVPVLGWWAEPSEVGPVDVAEVAAVSRIPMSELADPANRLRIEQPSGWLGAAFRVHGMLVWGFTAALVDRLLALGGWEQPWDLGRVEPLPADALRLAMRNRPVPGDERPAR